MVSNKVITYTNGQWRRFSKTSNFPKSKIFIKTNKETPTTYKLYRVDLIKYLVSGRYRS